MILVSVGSTLFQFARMMRLIEDLARSQLDHEKIIFQYGHTPPYKIDDRVELHPFISHEILMGYMKRARAIICHGGPATIYQALSFGKIPWVLPRQKRFGEHINDHQVDFCRFMAHRGLVNIITRDTNASELSTSRRIAKPREPKNSMLITYLDSLLPKS